MNERPGMTIKPLALIGACIAGALLWALLFLGVRAVLAAEPPLMCGSPVGQQRVFIADDLPGLSRSDVLAAMSRWNDVFAYFYGVDIFVEHSGPWYTADVIVNGETGRTWVQVKCSGWYWTQLHIGSDDAWRNREIIPHELGHALYLVDHIQSGSSTTGYLNPQFCPASGYTGAMSYCTSAQNWFQCYDGIYGDCDLVWDYWR